MESLQDTTVRLPIFKARKKIVRAAYENRTTVISGETGCGKTTQIPQYLLEAGFATYKCIAVTQPRRVATVAIAERVAEEVGTELGNKVGYSVRFENMTSAATKIKFLTDGMLLRESITDTLLLEYSVVILDEVHERTLSIDLLMGIVKNAQLQREKRDLLCLKIIVMSATLDAKHICDYFKAPNRTIAGRGYNIKIMSANTPQPNYVESALQTVFQIHESEDAGDILVFCTAQEEIDGMVSDCKARAVSLPADVGKIYPYALYGCLPSDQQLAVFRPAPEGTRKVIFATNIAETSITIPNIKYVVDTGMVKAKSFNALCGFDVLHVQKISKAQAEQRAGRAGREFNGVCYQLYTAEEYENFEDQTKPEILRTCLSSAILQMVGMGITRVAKFDFIDKPSEESIKAAIKLLTILEAVVDNKGNLKLTECGKKMVTFPLNPRYSKLIVSSEKHKCTADIVSIIALLSVESIFYNQVSKRGEFKKAREKFETIEGDLIMMLNVYKQFKRCKGNAKWCKKNFINARNVRRAIKIRKQLSALCSQMGINNYSTHSNEKVRNCLASGLFMNVALLSRNNTYRMLESNQEVLIHPSSCLYKKRLPCCIYTDLVQTSNVYMRNVTYIPEEMLRSVVPEYFKEAVSFS